MDVRVIAWRKREKDKEEEEEDGSISAASSVLIWMSVCRRLWFTVSGELNHTQVQLLSHIHNSAQVNGVKMRTPCRSSARTI